MMALGWQRTEKLIRQQADVLTRSSTHDSSSVHLGNRPRAGDPRQLEDKIIGIDARRLRATATKSNISVCLRGRCPHRRNGIGCRKHDS